MALRQILRGANCIIAYFIVMYCFMKTRANLCIDSYNDKIYINNRWKYVSIQLKACSFSYKLVNIREQLIYLALLTICFHYNCWSKKRMVSISDLVVIRRNKSTTFPTHSGGRYKFSPKVAVMTPQPIMLPDKCSASLFQSIWTTNLNKRAFSVRNRRGLSAITWFISWIICCQINGHSSQRYLSRWTDGFSLVGHGLAAY